MPLCISCQLKFPLGERGSRSPKFCSATCRVREWRRNNPKKHADSSKRYNEKYPGKHSARSAQWAKDNPGRRKDINNKYRRNRYKNDPEFRIKCDSRSRLIRAFKDRGLRKNRKTKLLIGCSNSDLVKHLISLFKPGMSLDNYGGREGWVIDHKIACCRFDLTDPEQVKRCFHYTNLQPLWAKDNLAKQKYDLQGIDPPEDFYNPS